MIVRISWYKIPEIRVIDQRLYRQRFVLLHHFLPIFVSILFNPWHFRESRDTHFNEWPSVQLLLWLMSRRSQPWPWPVSGLGMHWTKPQILILHPVSANKKWEMSKALRKGCCAHWRNFRDTKILINSFLHTDTATVCHFKEIILIFIKKIYKNAKYST